MRLVWPIHRWLSRLAPVVLWNVRILPPPHSSLTPVLTNGNALPAGELILLTHGCYRIYTKTCRLSA
jgi:hypothetical protein